MKIPQSKDHILHQTISSQSPKPAMTRARTRFNDQTEVGLRRLVTADEGLRYDLLRGLKVYDCCPDTARQAPDARINSPRGPVDGYVPLLFSWARNDGNALPLIAQQYHETRITYSFGPAPTGIDPTVPPQATLYLNYVYLDQDERQRFAQSQHQYLIEQLQYPGAENAVISTTNKKSQNVRLNFNHPCKAVIWIAKGTDHGVFTAGPQGTKASAYGPLYQSKLQLNGNDRFSIRYGSYFDRVQPFQTQGTNNAAGVYAYNFAFKPAEHQPSGTCNFSRIDNTTLNLIFKQAVTGATAVSDIHQEDYVPAAATNLQSLQIYAVSYNLYRVMGGFQTETPKAAHRCNVGSCIGKMFGLPPVYSTVSPGLQLVACC